MNAALMHVPAKDRPRKAFQASDFYQFGDPDDAGRPPAAAGAAMLELIKRKAFPRFALFVYQDLKAAAGDEHPPQRLAWIADDAILLAPYPLEGERWGGFLICQDTAPGRTREFRSERDERIRLVVPASMAGKGAETAEDRVILVASTH